MTISITQILNRVWNSTLDAVKVTPFGSFAAPAAADTVVVAYPTDTTETYTYKSGGTGGTSLMVLTLTYVDNTRAQLQSVVKS